MGKKKRVVRKKKTRKDGRGNPQAKTTKANQKGSTRKSELAQQTERLLVIDLLNKGFRNSEIAQATGLTPGQVSKHTGFARKAHMEMFGWKYEEMIALQLAKIELVEKEAWEAWEKSKQPEVTLTTEAGEPTGDDEEPGVKTKRTIKGTTGDARHLMAVLKSIELRHKTLKLDQFEGGGGDDPENQPLAHIPMVAIRISSREELAEVKTLESFKEMEAKADKLLSEEGNT